MLFKAYSVAAVTLTLSISAPVFSQTSPPASPIVEAAVKVNYSDLKLNTIAGAATFLARIRSAAYTVCNADLNNRAVLQSCMRESTERALAQIEDPLPAALYKGNISVRVAQNQ